MFSEKKYKKIVASVDIGSSSVAGSIVMFSKGNKPKIVYTSPRFFIKSKDNKKGIPEITALTEKVMVNLYEEANQRFKKSFFSLDKQVIDEVFCFLSTPWYSGQVVCVKGQNKNPTILSKNMVRTIMDKEVLGVLDQFDPDLSDSIKILEQNIVSTKLNGYLTKSIYNKQAKRIEIDIYFSFCKKDLYNSITKISNSVFGQNNIFVTQPVMMSSVFSELFSHHSNLVYLGLTSSSTSLVTFCRREISGADSFENGYGQITEKISERFGFSSAVSESFFRMYTQGVLESENKKIMTDLVNEWFTLWKNECLVIIKKFSKCSSSSTIFLLTHNNVTGIMSNLLLDSGLYNPSKQKLLIANLESLSSHVDILKTTTADPFIMLEAFSLSRINYSSL